MYIKRLEEWKWQNRFKSLEDATEYLLNYTADLGPLALQCLKRLKNKEIKIQELSQHNFSLRQQLKKEVITNEKNNYREK